MPRVGRPDGAADKGRGPQAAGRSARAQRSRRRRRRAVLRRAAKASKASAGRNRRSRAERRAPFWRCQAAQRTRTSRRRGSSEWPLYSAGARVERVERAEGAHFGGRLRPPWPSGSAGQRGNSAHSVPRGGGANAARAPAASEAQRGHGRHECRRWTLSAMGSRRTDGRAADGGRWRVESGKRYG